MSRLIDADELKGRTTNYDEEGYRIWHEWDIDNAPTVEYQGEECVNIKMSEEDKQKLLSALRNAKLKVLVEEERPQDEWVLITERLPDYMEHILVTFQKPNREPLVYRAVFIGSKFALDNGDTWNWNDPEIKAWMPLPEAYKE